MRSRINRVPLCVIVALLTLIAPAPASADDEGRERGSRIDLGLSADYRPSAGDPDCREQDHQAMQAVAARKQGEIAAGAGAALVIAGVVLSVITIAVAEADPPPETRTVAGLSIGAGALGASGGVAFGVAGAQFQQAWVHTVLAEMESRRCGGSLLFERR